MKLIPHGVFSALIASAIYICGCLFPPLSMAGDKNYGDLLHALSKSQLSLAEGLKQVTQGTEVPISAKFELDDNHQLSLSIYTAAKGLGVDAEHNILKEIAGSPEKTPWTTETEVFKDIPHVARAAKHLTLTAVAKRSLLEVVMRAKREHPGNLLAIEPQVHNTKAVFEVLIVNGTHVAEYFYDARTGKQVP